MQRNLFVVMRVCSPVIWSYLDAGFGAMVNSQGLLDRLLLLLLLARTCCSPFDPKKGCKTSIGITHLGNKDFQ